MRTRIAPMKKIARSLRHHPELMLNYFRAKKLISSGVVEGLNNKAKVTMRKSYGFRTYGYSNWPSITHSSYLGRYQPTISSDESDLLGIPTAAFSLRLSTLFLEHEDSNAAPHCNANQKQSEINE